MTTKNFCTQQTVADKRGSEVFELHVPQVASVSWDAEASRNPARQLPSTVGYKWNSPPDKGYIMIDWE